MQVEKKTIIDDLLERVNASPFVIVTDYNGLTVSQFEELRTRLDGAGSRIHVTKNSYIKRVIKDSDLPEGLAECLQGQTAIVTGEEDVCGAAKIVKNFHKEFSRPDDQDGCPRRQAHDRGRGEPVGRSAFQEISSWVSSSGSSRLRRRIWRGSSTSPVRRSPGPCRPTWTKVSTSLGAFSRPNSPSILIFKPITSFPGAASVVPLKNHNNLNGSSSGSRQRH